MLLFSVCEQSHSTVIKPEPFAEQYDCLKPKKEQKATVWEEHEEREMDTSGMPTLNIIVCHLQLLGNFKPEKQSKKTFCPLVNVTSYCCHLGMYRCSLEANLSPLMCRINANCNANINTFHLNVCIICSRSH